MDSPVFPVKIFLMNYGQASESLGLIITLQNADYLIRKDSSISVALYLTVQFAILYSLRIFETCSFPC